MEKKQGDDSQPRPGEPMDAYAYSRLPWTDLTNRKQQIQLAIYYARTWYPLFYWLRTINALEFDEEGGADPGVMFDYIEQFRWTIDALAGRETHYNEFDLHNLIDMVLIAKFAGRDAFLEYYETSLNELEYYFADFDFQEEDLPNVELPTLDNQLLGIEVDMEAINEQILPTDSSDVSKTPTGVAPHQNISRSETYTPAQPMPSSTQHTIPDTPPNPPDAPEYADAHYADIPDYAFESGAAQSNSPPPQQRPPTSGPANPDEEFEYLATLAQKVANREISLMAAQENLNSSQRAEFVNHLLRAQQGGG